MPKLTLFSFAADPEIIAAVDEARKKTKQPRSEYIRAALIFKLKSEGYKIDESLIQAPDRVTKKYSVGKNTGVMALGDNPVAIKKYKSKN